MKKLILFTFIIILSLFAIGCSKNYNNKSVEIEEKITTKVSGVGDELVFKFIPGEYHNHPTFAVWVEDMEGNYLHPLYVTRSVSSGIWGHGELSPGKWRDKPGKAVRTAALPYWFHKRGDGTMPAIPDTEYSLPDAITSATPKAGFYLKTNSGIKGDEPYRILMEINQTWDWNDYWHNNKYPGNMDYKTSSQPALVYAVTIYPNSEMKEYYLNPVGHSHYSGKNGLLYTDLSTFTTALEIFDEIKVTLK
ncbi:MAG: hypothetical protein ACLFQM_12665 [Fidelibacterota bacterium]